MTKIKKYVERIEEELHDAKNYAEKYVEYKAAGNTQNQNRYKDMANDELKHAMYLHDIATAEIAELNKVFQPTQEMLDKWDRSHREYVEKTAWIKQMLTM